MQKLPDVLNLKPNWIVVHCGTIDGEIVVNTIGDNRFINRLKLDAISMWVVPRLTLSHVRASF